VQVKTILSFFSQLWRQLRFALAKAKQGIACTPVADHLSYQSSPGHSFLAALYSSGRQEEFDKSLLV